MSGKFLTRASAITLALLLAACGGGSDGSSPLASNGDSGSTSGDSSGGTSGGDDATDEQQVTLELGTGSGSSFQSGAIAASATSLASGGLTRLEFNVVNASAGNALYNAEAVTATITSLCARSTFDSSITTTSGSFATTYEAGCAGDDTITASLSNGAKATVNITVAAPEANQLKIISTSPESIALSGSANTGRPSVSEVTFQLLDKDDKAITTGETVTFALSTTVGGISLSQDSTETDEEGYAKVRVNAGTVATVVSVTATYTPEGGVPIQTTSSPISISATIPDQNSFSISIEDNFLPNAAFYDGQQVPLTIRAADRNNNRISDAVVNFVTTYGSIESECILEDGACSVTWVSQGERPEDGIVQILARTVGEESFRDLNSDGKYSSSADLFEIAENDKGEAFLDRNRNGVRDADEEYFDYNDNDQYDGANGIYNGTACFDNVNCTTDLLEIAQTAKIFMASDFLSVNFATTAAQVSPGDVCVIIAGVFEDSVGNEIQGPPPGETSVEFSTTNGTILAPSSLTTTTYFSTEPAVECVTVEADDTSDTGTLTVEVTPPAPYKGTPYIKRITLID